MSYQHHYTDGTPIHYPLGKVVCIGRNYAEHAKELNNPVPTEPLLFIKAGSCTVPLEGGFSIPSDRGAVHYEAEIAVLIGAAVAQAQRGRGARCHLRLRPGAGSDPARRAGQAQEKGHPWEIAKSFDGACVLAPFVPGDAVEDLGDIGIRLTINGEVRQDGNSSQMLNAILPLLQHIAGHFSLQPGDVVLTGTPAGVGPLNQGDELVLELVGLSRFESRVL